MPESIFAGLTNLHELSLNHNKLTTLPASVFSGLTNLQELHLGSNDLTAVPESIFAGLTNLNELFLYNNSLTALPASVFSGLTNLRKLWLDSNGLTSLPDGLFAGLSKLTYLVLEWGNTPLQGPQPFELSFQLRAMGNDQFQVTVPSGAPFAITVGIFVDSQTQARVSTTIPAGSTQSPAFSVPQLTGSALLTAKPTSSFDINSFKGLTPFAYSSSSAFGQLQLTGPIRFADAQVENPRYLQDRNIEALTLPEAVDGGGDIEYTLTGTTADGSLKNGLPVGLTFDADTRQLTGIPAAIGVYRMTYQVTDSSRQPASLAFNIEVVAGGICDRTAQVRTAIVNAVSDVDDCAFITDAHLAGITTLKLDNRSITGLATGDFAGLAQLRTLTINGNSSLVSLPNTIFAGLTNLKFLELRGTGLASLPDFSSLSQLISLTYSSNSPLSLPDNVFAGLTQLQYLHLSGSTLTSLPNTAFTELTNLKYLLLLGTRLANLPDLSSLAKLTTLTVESINLTSLPAGVFAGLSNLRYLTLAHNRLANLPGNVFTGLTKLEKLSLYSNGLTSLPDLSTLTQLKTLHLAANGLTSLPNTAFTGLINLEKLYLDRNGLTNLPDFSALTRLQTLRLDSNNLASLPDAAFESLSALTRLDLTCQGRVSLERPCPNTSFELSFQLRSVGNGQYQVTLPPGAPFAITVGIFVDSQSQAEVSTTIPAGSTQSSVFAIPGLTGSALLTAKPTSSFDTIKFKGITPFDQSSSAAFGKLQVIGPVHFVDAEQGNLHFLQNRNIEALTLPEAMDGAQDIEYSLIATTDDGTLKDDLPDGLSFSRTTRQLTGTPTTPGTYRATYRATDSLSRQPATLTFEIEVFEPVGFGQDRIARTYPRDNPIATLELPEATGGSGALRYSLVVAGLESGGLPAGLSFDADSRTLAGTPEQTDDYSLTYQSTDSLGNTAELTLNIQIVDAVHFGDAEVADQRYRQGSNINLPLPASTGGAGALSYSVSAANSDGSTLKGDMVAGLRFSESTRQLTGTPAEPGTYSLTYRVTDPLGGDDSLTFTIQVGQVISFTSTTLADLPYQQGQPIEHYLPEAQDHFGTPVYSLTGTSSDGTGSSDLPAGLSFDATTRKLSGTPTVPGIYSLTYQVSDSFDERTKALTFNIEVYEPLGFGQKRIADRTYLIGDSIDEEALPGASGGHGALQYRLAIKSAKEGKTSDLPLGLLFNADSRTLSGTPKQTDTYALVYQVADSLGNTAFLPLNIQVVNAVNFAGAQVADRVYQENERIEDLPLPASTGGGKDHRYSLAATTEDGSLTGDLLPTGLSFDAATRKLTGIPTAAGTYRMAYRTTDSLGKSDLLSFSIQVQQALAFVGPVQPRRYPHGVAIATLTLPGATGGEGSYSYSLTANTKDAVRESDLPAGLSFDAATRQLTGTPTAAGIYNMVYQVTDSNQRQHSVNFVVEVLSRVDLASDLTEKIQKAAAFSLLAGVGQSVNHRLGQMAAGSANQFNLALDGSSFVMPLTGPGADPTKGQSGLALWMQTDQQQLGLDASATEDFAWDGGIVETRLGLDGQISPDLLLGLMISSAEGTFDYRGFEDAWQGVVRTDLTTVSPYLGWNSDGGLGLWASFGHGQGEMDILDPNGESRIASEVSTTSSLVGLQGRLLSGQVSDLNLRAAYSAVQIEGLDSGSGPAMQTRGWQMRLVIENTNRLQLKDGASLTPSLQLAVRKSNSLNGNGVELGAGLAYQSSGNRLQLELGTRTFSADDSGYEESSYSVSIRLRQSSDKRGLSFSLQPSHGLGSSRAEELWDERNQLQHLGNNPTTAETSQLQSELAWGLSTGGRGVITPYGKMNLSEGSSRFSLGNRWELGDHFSLSLERSTQRTVHWANPPQISACSAP